MIQFESMGGKVLRAEARDGAVFINGAQVVGLERNPRGNGVCLILEGELWPMRVAFEQLQALAPIAEYLPSVRLCWECQRPILYLDEPPPIEPCCDDCALRRAQQRVTWETQRAQQRGSIAALEQPELEALYAEAKAQVEALPPTSAGWRYWRQVQLDASGVIVTRRRGANGR